MKKIWHLFSMVILTFTMILCVFELYRSIVFVINQFFSASYINYIFLAIGIVLCVVLQKTLLRKNNDFLQTMSHEAAHMLIGGIFLQQKITSLNATAEKGGVVKYTGKENILMLLAPYYLPYLTFTLLLIRLMIKPECLPIIDTLIGISLMFHVSCFAKQIRSYQTDLICYGLFRSYLFIVTLIAFNFAIIFYALGVVDNVQVDIIRANVIFFKQAWADVVWAIKLL